MIISQNVHTIIELDENEAYLLRRLLAKCDLEELTAESESLARQAETIRMNLRYSLSGRGVTP